MKIYIFIFAVTKWINNVNEFNNCRGDFVILQEIIIYAIIVH